MGRVASAWRPQAAAAPGNGEGLVLKPRLLIVASHPIQYHAPWFRALAADGSLDLEVLFLALPDAQDQGVDFGRAFEWDVPLLEGYAWRPAASAAGGITGGYASLRLRNPQADLRSAEYDAILVTGWHKYGMLQCLRAAVRSGRPVLVRAESNGLAPLGWHGRLKARWLLRGATRLLPIGTANRSYYEQLGLSARVGQSIPYFVDNEYFAKRADEARLRRDELRHGFGIPEQATCFLFAGKFVPKKRPTDVLAALAITRERHPNVHLLLVGSGGLEPELRRAATGGGLPVSFGGFLNQSEMPAAYAAADCLVLPSDYGETWGLVVNEAMACGLPAIVSDRVGCGPDLVSEGVTGYVFRFSDVSELARKMARCAGLDGSERSGLAEAAKVRVSAEYSLAQACALTVQEVGRAIRPR